MPKQRTKKVLIATNEKPDRPDWEGQLNITGAGSKQSFTLETRADLKLNTSYCLYDLERVTPLKIDALFTIVSLANEEVKGRITMRTYVLHMKVNHNILQTVRI